jgi:hypothetical protein
MDTVPEADSVPAEPAGAVAAAVESAVADIGSSSDQIKVTIGPQFLNLFSEQLYSSPNKAFEELVSNSWDAGATSVYIGVPESLTAPGATVWVLDNGESMDLDGLAALWDVGNSPKSEVSTSNGRPQIGKFGIGKLSTYILAHQLTYICRASDGIVRAVTMDYRRIDGTDDPPKSLHLHEGVALDVRELGAGDLEQLLGELPDGSAIKDLLVLGIPALSLPADAWQEYGHAPLPAPPSTASWTLALLTGLKQAGQRMQPGRIRQILRTALPLGNSITVVFNGTPLVPSKADKPITKSWELGTEFPVTSIELPSREDDSGEVIPGDTKAITVHSTPFPHILVEGLQGPITGHITLYEDKLTGGKSDEVGRSHGFFVNVLGRVINTDDPYFHLENLNHAAWAKFRAAVRADGLNRLVSVTREDLRRDTTFHIFLALLRSIFNLARSEHDRLSRAEWPDAGHVLTDKWKAIPLTPLRKLIEERTDASLPLPNFVIYGDDNDQIEWREITGKDHGDVLDDVRFEATSGPADALARYDLGQRAILVNQNHPYVLEHCERRDDQTLVRNAALVEILTDAYMVYVGVGEDLVQQVRDYRDQLLRTIAQVNRKSGVQIAEMLVDASKHEDFKALERISGDALEYLGFAVRRLGQSGEPEGVALAPLRPAPAAQPSGEEAPASYTFNYDAKSSKSGRAKTGNLNLSGVKRHRIRHEADHSLVVAPDFQIADKLIEECVQEEVTPIRAVDLGRLVLLTAAFGPFDLQRLRGLLELRHPDKVSEWIDTLYDDSRAAPRRLTIDLLVQALEDLGHEEPNALHTKVIANAISRVTDKQVQPNNLEVSKLIQGLQVMAPQLIRVTTSGDVFLSVAPTVLRDALRLQVSGIPPEYRMGLDALLGGASTSPAAPGTAVGAEGSTP